MKIEEIQEESKCLRCNMLYVDVNNDNECECLKGFAMLANCQGCKWFDTPKHISNQCSTGNLTCGVNPFKMQVADN